MPPSFMYLKNRQTTPHLWVEVYEYLDDDDDDDDDRL